MKRLWWLVVLVLWPYSGARPADLVVGSQQVGAQLRPPGNGYKFGSVFPSTGPCAVSSFSWYAKGNGAQQAFVPVVYSTDAAGLPSALLVKGPTTTVAPSQAAGWVTVPMPPASMAAGRWFLGLVSGPASQGAANSAAPSPGSGFYNQNPYPSAPAAFGAASREDLLWSMYVTCSPVSSVAKPVFDWPAPSESVWTELRRRRPMSAAWDPGFYARVETSSCGAPYDARVDGALRSFRDCRWPILPTDKDWWYEVRACKPATSPQCSDWMSEGTVVCSEGCGSGCPDGVMAVGTPCR